MKNDTMTVSAPKVPVTSIVRNLATLEAQCKFEGEGFASLPKMTSDESIHLGVTLVNRGEETKARGVFVLAEASRGLQGEKAKTFATDLRAFIVTEAREKAVNSVKLLGLDGKRLERALADAKTKAEETAQKRADNIGSTLKAARWMLDNPKAFAPGVSVFSVTQANAYLEAPKPNAEGKVDEAKLAVHKAVKKALAKPGISQAQIKQVISEAKPAPAEVIDTRTDEQKKQSAAEANKRLLIQKAEGVLAVFDLLINSGEKPHDVRQIRVSSVDGDKRVFADLAREIAKVAGLELK